MSTRTWRSSSRLLPINGARRVVGSQGRLLVDHKGLLVAFPDRQLLSLRHLLAVICPPRVMLLANIGPFLGTKLPLVVSVGGIHFYFSETEYSSNFYPYFKFGSIDDIIASTIIF